MPSVAEEQQRNLWILAGVGLALVLLLLLTGLALYFGWELPPYAMRTYYTSPTGYAAPPQGIVAPPGTVPRGALTLVGPGEELPERGRPELVPVPRSVAPGAAAGEREGGVDPAEPPSAERVPASPRAAESEAQPREEGPAAHPEHEHEHAHPEGRTGPAPDHTGTRPPRAPESARADARSAAEGEHVHEGEHAHASEGEHAHAPAAAERLRNPLPDTPEVLRLGKRMYLVNCAMCHGAPGERIGPVGERYTPRPPNLTEHVPAHSAGRLYYLITYGIRSTPTPEAARYLPRQWHAFRAQLSPRERWAIITYLKQAFGP